jgi:hypothetical protein
VHLVGWYCTDISRRTVNKTLKKIHLCRVKHVFVDTLPVISVFLYTYCTKSITYSKYAIKCDIIFCDFFKRDMFIIKSFMSYNWIGNSMLGVCAKWRFKLLKSYKLSVILKNSRSVVKMFSLQSDTKVLVTSLAP